MKLSLLIPWPLDSSCSLWKISSLLILVFEGGSPLGTLNLLPSLLLPSFLLLPIRPIKFYGFLGGGLGIGLSPDGKMVQHCLKLDDVTTGWYAGGQVCSVSLSSQSLKSARNSITPFGSEWDSTRTIPDLMVEVCRLFLIAPVTWNAMEQLWPQLDFLTSIL